jgi:hypothetical protein
MPADFSIIYQGIAAGAASVQAVLSALLYARTHDQVLTREKVFEIARQARAAIEENKALAEEAARQLEEMDERTERILQKKIEESDKKWEDDMLGTNDPAVWARVTDERRMAQCAILRIIRDKIGGVLPKHWYSLWIGNRCS